jgi:hypothetical protein
VCLLQHPKEKQLATVLGGPAVEPEDELAEVIYVAQ